MQIIYHQARQSLTITIFLYFCTFSEWFEFFFCNAQYFYVESNLIARIVF